jgi:hypothetical protein
MNFRAPFALALPVLALASAPFHVGLAQEPRRDSGKALVERRIERALDTGGAREPLASGTVAPGLVRWHADFASACAAAERSGKPVLLFQLLGRLDDELC